MISKKTEYKFEIVHPWILELKDNFDNWHAVMSYYRFHQIQFEILKDFIEQRKNTIAAINDLTTEKSIERISNYFIEKPDDITEYTEKSFQIIANAYKQTDSKILCLKGEDIINHKDVNYLLEKIYEKISIFLNNEDLKYPLPEMNNSDCWKRSYHKDYDKSNHKIMDRGIIKKNLKDWIQNPDSWRILFLV